MTSPPLLTIVLAAGQGVRMQSGRPKVLHAVGGRSMLGHVLSTAKQAGAQRIALVVAPGMDAVRQEAAVMVPDLNIFEQQQQAGTADAVLAARAALKGHKGDVLVVFADNPLLQQQTCRALVETLDAGAQVAVLGFEASDPEGYGRLVRDSNGALVAIREHRDATPDERRIRLCNAGIMAFRVPDLAGLLGRIGNDNAKREFYLTDAVGLAVADGLAAAVVVADAEEALGVNSRPQLADAEAVFQKRMRRKAMESGVTLIDPATVWLSFDTVLGRDVVIEPNVFFGPGVTVEAGVHILANCHISGAHIRSGARIGPFARLRPGSDIGSGAHIGNFVEVKNVAVGEGAKANHLAYLGDGSVGEGANIGAGTIFCNYDGFSKNLTVVGKGAFIGSNSSLVAPIRIGDGAYVGSGSVITKNVEADALALERAPQEQRPGWAAKFRTMMTRRAKSKGR
jgi:bifunctional UDP-N-acetylglucosamine pyrophosphorylase / glucosamine-1-phosphate N-acetyltransferase